MLHLETVKVVFYGKEIDVKVWDRLDRCHCKGLMFEAVRVVELCRIG
jgi:hypothetical protein